METSATLVLVLLVLFTFLQSVVNGFDSCPHTYTINPFKYRVPENQPYRTSYHFQPPQNWMNDPNGPMYYKGVYHLFYQHNPNAATFGDGIVWGHSVSFDLINWIHLNNAIEPSESYDIISCWSGSATILLDGKPVIMYTGIDCNRHQVQNLAMPKNLSDPFLREWVKHTQNPVITPSDEVAEVDNFRDPSTAWHGKDGKWRIIIGAQKGDQGRAILYQSEDFVNWKLDPIPFYATDNTGVCECPDFYPVSINGTNGVDTSVESSSVRHVAKVGYLRMAHDYYFVGKYLSDEEKFIADAKFTGTSLDLRYDYGKFYASKSFFDYAKNRRILWGWVNESDSERDDIQKGWAGVQSIPRQVWLDNRSANRLVQWPIEEVENLRSKNISINGEKLVGGSILEVSGITASQADIEVLFEVPELEDNAESLDPSGVDPQLLCSNAPRSGIIGPFGLLALASKDLREHTAISFRVYKTSNKYVGLMCSDQSRSSLQNDLDKTTYGTFFDVDSNLRTISLRSLIDHSIIESFGEGGRVCISSRVYPLLATGNDAHLYVFNNGTTSVIISKLNAWCTKEAEIGSLKNMSYKTC